MPAFLEKDETKKAAMFDKIEKEDFPAFSKLIEGLLTANGGEWLAGKQVRPDTLLVL